MTFPGRDVESHPKAASPAQAHDNFPSLSPQMSDWDRFAAEEYELLVAEEGNTEGMDEL